MNLSNIYRTIDTPFKSELPYHRQKRRGKMMENVERVSCKSERMLGCGCLENDVYHPPFVQSGFLVEFCFSFLSFSTCLSLSLCFSLCGPYGSTLGTLFVLWLHSEWRRARARACRKERNDDSDKCLVIITDVFVSSPFALGCVSSCHWALLAPFLHCVGQVVLALKPHSFVKWRCTVQWTKWGKRRDRTRERERERGKEISSGIIDNYNTTQKKDLNYLMAPFKNNLSLFV